MTQNIILHHKCVFVINDTKKRPHVSISDLQLREYIYGYKTPSFSIPIIPICANVLLLSVHFTLTKIPPSAHHTKIPSTILHSSFSHDIKTQNLPQFTALIRKTHIQCTMWVKYKKLITHPGSTSILTRHCLTTLEDSARPKKKIIRIKITHCYISSP